MRVPLPIPEGLQGQVLDLRFPRGWRWQGPDHRHDELELNLLRAGSATVLLGQRRYRLRPGTMVWLFPGQDHMVVDVDGPVGLWVAVFRPRLVAACSRGGGRAILRASRPPGHFCRRLGDAQRRALEHHLATLCRDDLDSAQHEAGLRWLLMEAWRAYQEADDLPSGDEVHPAVAASSFLIHEDPGAWDLEALAERVGVSRAWLSRTFKRQMGQPLSEFRNRQRIAAFVRCYGRGRDRTLLDAALEAGFHSYPQFFRVCRALLGCTPAEYRAQVRRS